MFIFIDMKRLILFLFIVLFTSCSPYLFPDGDDVYINNGRSYYSSPYSYNFWYFNWHPFRFGDWGYRYYSPYYNPRPIIVVPKQNEDKRDNYGRRPDRTQPRNNPPVSGGRRDIRKDK